ncbi:transcriptional regulator, GntR family [Devosia lucknowensis]|uniref:Transcriptional regulator, GntR family n=1 Tax=Devosia lucknowensis TaxID=1096929 RepID=A0A1Y6G6P9_9HYPH|nr:GntR family transcriptional regulator [Devosia lucknowensis]SMQ85444.1 transcriptional regulator, GntR family [Devosia lucknowensis]
MKQMRLEQPKSLAEMVAVRLRQAIIDGEIGLGESIAEEKLAESFGVSRTPVRDALIQLEQQGLVVIQPKRGSFVFSPTAEDVTFICEYRKMIEVHAMKFALGRNKGELMARISDVTAAMGAAMQSHDAVSYGKLDTDFHQAFVDCSDNPYVQDAYQLVSGRIAALRTHLTRPIEHLRQLSFTEHQKLVELVAAEDIDGFGRLMDAHVDRTGEIYVVALTGAGEDNDQVSA